jgi:hypothetical protein
LIPSTRQSSTPQRAKAPLRLAAERDSDTAGHTVGKFFLDLSVVDRRLHDDLRKIYLHLKAPRFDLHRPHYGERGGKRRLKAGIMRRGWVRPQRDRRDGCIPTTAQDSGTRIGYSLHPLSPYILSHPTSTLALYPLSAYYLSQPVSSLSLSPLSAYLLSQPISSLSLSPLSAYILSQPNQAGAQGARAPRHGWTRENTDRIE